MRLLFLSFAVAILLGNTTAAAGMKHFYGRVVDAQTGKPMKNVRVRVFNQVDTITAALRVAPALPNSATPSRRKPRGWVQPAATVVSDANGRFSAKVRDLGPADIVCDQPGGGGGGNRIANASADKFLEIRFSVPKRAGVSTTSPR